MRGLTINRQVRKAAKLYIRSGNPSQQNPA